jgi:hypothetical protein
MPESFEGRDLSDAEFWGVDLSRARFRDVNLTNATVVNAWLIDVDIDALVENVTINGVDVTAFVNEHDPWYPLRAMLRPEDPEGMRSTWRALEEVWASTLARARSLPEEKVYQSVNGEWSFVQTLQHLAFAIDKWFTAPILGEPFHPIVLPNSGSNDLDWPGRDRDASPTFAQALAVREERAARFGAYLDTVSAADLSEQVEVLENGANPVQECVFVVFEEAFAHNRYALRDLTQLEPAG